MGRAAIRRTKPSKSTLHKEIHHQNKAEQQDYRENKNSQSKGSEQTERGRRSRSSEEHTDYISTERESVRHFNGVRNPLSGSEGVSFNLLECGDATWSVHVCVPCVFSLIALEDEDIWRSRCRADVCRSWFVFCSFFLAFSWKCWWQRKDKNRERLGFDTTCSGSTTTTRTL